MRQDDVENSLAACRLAAPRTGLRAQVIEAALARRQVRRTERLLPWAVAVLVVTLVWAHFEDRTAQRMVRAAAASANPYARQAESQESPAMAALPIHPRMSLPLPEGCISTRIRVSILSVEETRLDTADMDASLNHGPVSTDLEAHPIKRRTAPCRSV